MAYLLLTVIGIGEAAGACWLFWERVGKKASAARRNVRHLEEELSTREGLLAKINALYSEMIDIRAIRGKMDEVQLFRESLKAERGRITITQAELETVENRLRELEEIERELEASGVETKEEINILTMKKDELKQKNVTLGEQLSESLRRMDEVMGEIELSAQVQERVDRARADLVRTQEQIDLLLEKVQEGNEQYFIMKQRYDALDIEYAQLYEKFSASEAAGAGEEER